MTYFTDLHSYLHQSSLLIQAYPDTRVTTKYSSPSKPKTKKSASAPPTSTSSEAAPTDSVPTTAKARREAREPAATLTLKTFHPHSGICLKYQTDKAAEVGRLMTGLGRLAKGEVIEMPSTNEGGGAAAAANAMDVDSQAPAVDAKTATQMTQQQQTQQGGGGKKKKKGKK